MYTQHVSGNGQTTCHLGKAIFLLDATIVVLLLLLLLRENTSYSLKDTLWTQQLINVMLLTYTYHLNKRTLPIPQ